VESSKRYLHIPGRRFSITRKKIEEAISVTKSNSEAARWLGVSFNTYKKYATMFNLYDDHKNQSGKGIHKVIRDSKYSLEDILKGKYPNYSSKNLKKRLIDAGYFQEECSICGWNEERITDNKICLHLDYIDGDEHNKVYDNLRIICPNCYFTNVGNFLNAKKFC
jgi:hypothetical protein